MLQTQNLLTINKNTMNMKTLDMKAWAESARNGRRRLAIPIMTHPGIELCGYTVRDAVTDGEVHARAILALNDRYPADACSVIMDLTVEAEAFGAHIVFPENEVPSVTDALVHDLTEIEALEIPTLEAGRIPQYLKANRIVAEALGDKPLFAGCIGPFSLAGRLFGMTELMMAVLQYAVYAENPKHFIKAFDKFLEICDRHRIKAMPIFFDDCVFGANADPVTGPQPEPLKGWYAWAWSPSPGHTMVIDERTHPLLETYVKEIMTRFGQDDRIFVWDLYNEPTNSGLGDRSLPLLKSVVKWAREVDVKQPLTVGVWCGNEGLNRFCLDNSDIVSFHCYADANHTRNTCRELKKEGRPVICTEWMNRPAASTIPTVLPVFAEEEVGCMMWGLVNGKTQTDLPWGHRPEHGEYKGPWQHDIYHGDFTPYDQTEIDLLKKYCK